jgi:hypothetical protein
MAAGTPFSSGTTDDLDSAFVVAGTFSAARSRMTPLESYPGNKRSGAEQLGHDEHGESKTSGRLALIADRQTARRGRRFAAKVIGRVIGSHVGSLKGWRHTAAYVRYVTPSLMISSAHRARRIPWVVLLG